MAKKLLKSEPKNEDKVKNEEKAKKDKVPFLQRLKNFGVSYKAGEIAVMVDRG